MRQIIVGAALAALTLSVPLAANAQVIRGTENGAQRGADEGAAAAGPLGGIVGGAVGAGVGAATGAVGAATGVVGDIFGADERPRFHDYVVEHHYPSYRYDGDVRVGAVLPGEGPRYYEVPGEFHAAHRYRYAVINDQTVLIDPVTHRIVQILD